LGMLLVLTVVDGITCFAWCMARGSSVNGFEREREREREMQMSASAWYGLREDGQGRKKSEQGHARNGFNIAFTRSLKKNSKCSNPKF